MFICVIWEDIMSDSKNEKDTKYALSFKVSEEVRLFLIEIAEKEDRSMANVASRIITDYMKNYKLKEK